MVGLRVEDKRWKWQRKESRMYENRKEGRGEREREDGWMKGEKR